MKIGPPPEILHQLLRYEPETGKLFWTYRPEAMFKSMGHCKRWNSKYADKEAFKTPLTSGYLRGSIFDVSYRTHRVVWAMMTGEWPTFDIDHEDTNRANNKWVNLRAASPEINSKNRGVPISNTSGIVGVCWDKRKRRWRAQIKDRYIMYNLGYFDSIEEAAEARAAAVKQHNFHPQHGQPNRGISI